MGRRRVSPKPCAPSHLSSHTGRRCPATGTDQGACGEGGPRPEQSVTQSVTVLTRRTTFCTQGEVPGQDGTGKFPKTARRREGRRLKEGRKGAAARLEPAGDAATEAVSARREVAVQMG